MIIQIREMPPAPSSTHKYDLRLFRRIFSQLIVLETKTLYLLHTPNQKRMAFTAGYEIIEQLQNNRVGKSFNPA